MKPYLGVLFVLIFIVMIGCSSGTGILTSPVKESSRNVESIPNHHLLGLYQFTADPASGTLDYVPLRMAEMHLNALPFLEPPALIYLSLESLEFNGDIIEADIGLRHPFSGLTEFTGFDVCGIFISNGSTSGFTDSDIVLAGEDDTRLLNPDGYSRWWNPVEFPLSQGSMFAYNDGLLGTPDSYGNYSSTLNAYKFYCDDLNADDDVGDLDPSSRCMFSPGQKNIRHYSIDFTQGLIFNYAVDACWEFPGGSPPWDVPDDFGPSANRAEAWNVDITEAWNTLWNDGVDNGGNLRLSINVWDHFNPDLNTVSVESPGDFPIVSSSMPTTGGPGYSTYVIDINGATPQASGNMEILISVESEEEDFQGFISGVNTTAYFTYSTTVATEQPATISVLTPNGGEQWGIGGEDEITWNSEALSGTVFIDYSKDYFVSDINSIATNEPNDGTYTWTIPDDPSDTVRVRVSSTVNSAVNGISDDDFSILSGWARTWGGTYIDRGRDVAVDNSGSVFIVGEFGNTVDFDPGSDVENHTAVYELGGFLSKFDSTGNFQWARTWDVPADSVAVDSIGNIYVTGDFWGTRDFDPGIGIENKISYGINDVYLLKLNPNGDFQDVITWGGSFNEGGEGVTTDSSDNVYVSGSFTSTVDFDPGPGTDNHMFGGAFLSKFNSSGTWQWARTWGLGGASGFDVCTDANNCLIVAGRFQAPLADFDPGPDVDNHSSNGSNDAYVSKFNSNGDFQWAQTWGDTGNDGGLGVAVDPSGNVSITGYFIATVDFDPGSGSDNHASNGATDVFLSLFNTNGNFQWAGTWGSSTDDQGYAVSVDAAGNIYTTGIFSYTVDFDPGAGTYDLTSNAFRDIFLSKIDVSGNLLWARQWGYSSISSFSVYSQASGIVYLAGYFQGNTDFDPGPGTDYHQEVLNNDVFLLKVLPDGYW